MAIKAKGQITLSSVVDVKATYRYYLLQSSTLDAPSIPTVYPPTTWDDAEPTYTEGSTNSLYFVDCTVFCDDTFIYSEVSLSSSYEAAKVAYNKAVNAQGSADSANNKVDELTVVVQNQETEILKSSEAIILTALESYVETSNYEEFRAAVNSQLALLANELTVKFTESMTRIENVNGDLQAKYNTITKYFTFDINGLTIGQEDNPNKVVIDNDEISILVNGVVVQKFDAEGKAKIPELNVTTSMNLLGFLIDQDSAGNVHCEFVGGEG